VEDAYWVDLRDRFAHFDSFRRIPTSEDHEDEREGISSAPSPAAGLDFICRGLKRTYWATTAGETSSRSRSANSVCFGVYDQAAGTQIGLPGS